MFFSLRDTLLYFLTYTVVEFMLYGAIIARNYNRRELQNFAVNSKAT
jgi:hypothetical protein